MFYLSIFIFFLGLLSYYRKKGIAAQENAEETFWQREREANHTRRKDISGLPYITIPLEKFPMDICDNAELKEFERTLAELSAKKILNLGGQTNTELKLQHGPSNLDALTEYDQNFVTLCRTLVSYAECLSKLGFKAQAQEVLEFGISCGSDHSKNYLMLADFYLKQENSTAFRSLLTQAEALECPMKDTILKQLHEKEAAVPSVSGTA